MPLYEFVCEKCGQNFEELQSSSSLGASCPKCGSAATHKLISAPVRHRSGASPDAAFTAAAPSSGGGCAGCSGGNCGSCGR